MSKEKFFAMSGTPGCGGVVFKEDGPITPITTLSRDFYEGGFFAEAGWIMKPHKKEGLIKHDSDELMMFIGCDVENPHSLNATIELQIENDILTLTENCFVFVPGGTAHGNFEVKSLDKPVICYTFHPNRDYYEAAPAQATAEKGKFADNAVYKYAPVDGRLPSAPEGFLIRLLWIDGKKLQGSPYTEAVWFLTTNDTGPSEHDHDFDEVIAFIGSDPSKPHDLNGEISLYIDGEYFSFTKNCLAYIPRGVDHSPILVPKLDKPLIHFSGGNGGDYIRSRGDF